MEKEVFEDKKEELNQLVIQRLENCSDLSEEEQISLERIVNLFREYSYDQRLYLKGKMTRMIIDSLTLDFSLSEKLIQFDKGID